MNSDELQRKIAKARELISEAEMKLHALAQGITLQPTPETRREALAAYEECLASKETFILRLLDLLEQNDGNDPHNS